MTDNLLRIARAFARALDEEDYVAASKLLDPNCVYHIQGSEFTGPEAILAEYEKNGTYAAETFDSVAYESDVRPTGDREAVITFTDHLRHRGHELVHTCEQLVELSEADLVQRIEHRDLPGQAEALSEFFRETGLASGNG